MTSAVARWKGWFVFALCAAGMGNGFAQTAASASDKFADTVLVHGTVLTVDAQDSVAQAIALRDGKIVRVGSDQAVLALAGPRTRVVDLQGRTATPGLIDSHGHFADGGMAELYHLNLSDASSVAEVARRVQARVHTLKPGEWLIGDGWDEGKLRESRYLYAEDLDRVAPLNPVWLTQTTGHYGVANSMALRRAGLPLLL